MKKLISSGECILFLGAGASLSSLDNQGNSCPSTAELTRKIALEFLGEDAANRETDLKSVAFYAENQKSRRDLNKFIINLLSDLEPSIGLKLIPRFKWKAIYTTNYDTLVEKAYDEYPDRAQKLNIITSTSDYVENNEGTVNLYKIHGCIRSAHTDQGRLIITEDDYVGAEIKRKTLYARLTQDLAHHTFFYIGNSRTDSDLVTLIDLVSRELDGIKNMQRSYALAPGYEKYHADTWSSKKITLLDETTDSFFQLIDSLYENNESRYIRKQENRFNIGLPEKVIDNLQITEEQAINFAGSIEPLLELKINEEPNIENFYKGDKANWSIFEHKVDIIRDNYWDILGELVDEELITPARNSIYLLLAEAGAGKSTLSRRAAYTLSKEFDLPVFYLKEGSRLRKEIIQLLCESYNKKIYLFIDNASDQIDSLLEIVNDRTLRELPFCLFLNERTNEWNEKIKFVSLPIRKTFGINDLTSNEIEDILKKLSELNILGILKYKTHEERVSLFEKRAKKQLLVALREVTEGSSFEDIIIDEAKNIPGKPAQDAYTYICMLYSFGIMTRASLLSRILGINIVSLPEYVLDPALKIIINDFIEEESYFRARHQKIAEIIFTRYLYTSDKRFEIIMKVLESIDLGYENDKKAFKSLFQNRDLVERLEDYEKKKAFFERVIKIDSENLFAWQHYALMELKEKNYEVAKNLLEEKALKKQPGNKFLKHTLGLVFSSLAINSENIYQADRYYKEAQNQFEYCIRRSKQDSYAYHSLASMYVNRSKKENEKKVDLIKQAYDLLYEGIKNCNDKSTLYQELARIEQLTNRYDLAENHLIMALKAAPENITTLYLYAKMCYKQKRYDEAKDITEKILTKDEYIPWVNYLRALIEVAINKDNSEIIRYYFNRAHSYTNNYYKLVHAYYLYTIGETQESNLLLTKVDHTILGKDSRTICKPPLGLPRFLTCEGIVKNIHETYGFIKRDYEGDDIYFKKGKLSLSDRSKLKTGCRVSMNILFGYLGAIATNVKII